MTSSNSDLFKHIEHLEKEIKILESMLKPAGTGNLHTAIGVLQWRIEHEKQSFVDNWRRGKNCSNNKYPYYGYCCCENKE